MAFKRIVGTLLAVGATTLAAAEIVGIAATPDSQTTTVEKSYSTPPVDSMPDFLAAVAGIPIRNDRREPDEARDSYLTGDNQQQTDPGDANQRHLGLGFAHGMSNRNTRPQDAVSGESKTLTFKCSGNGHIDNGLGYEQPSSGDNIGHRGCGRPSPSE